MTPDTPETPAAPGAENRQAENRQAARGLGEADPSAAGLVATGDRREEVHFETDPDQLVVARHLDVPPGPLPPQDDGVNIAAAEADVPPVEDVRVAPEGPSVWDARPTGEDAERDAARGR